MKKISLLTLAVATGLAFATPAQAMNTENPLYMPKAGNFFIKGDMNYDNTEKKENGLVGINDDLQSGEWSDSFLIGYGFSNNFAVTVTNDTPTHIGTNLSANLAENGDHRLAAPVITGIFRAVKNGNVVLDIVGSLNPALQYNEAMALGAGIRAGVTTKKMTLAIGGHVGYGMSYDGTDLSTGNDAGYEIDDNMAYKMTVDLQFVLGKDMSLNIGGEYFFIDEQDYSFTGGKGHMGEIDGYRTELGLNFEMKKNILITPYISYLSIEQDQVLGEDYYEMEGMEYGVRFGMEF